MRLPHRLQGQKVNSQGHGAGAYCGGHLAAQLVVIIIIVIIIIKFGKDKDSLCVRCLNDLPAAACLYTGVYFACVMIMCTLSVTTTVVVLNFHHRSPEMYEMPGWVSPCSVFCLV